MSKQEQNNAPTNCPFERAFNMGHNVRKNFDWPNVQEVMNKVKEEISELEEALVKSKAEQIHELGDVLFTLTQVARHLNIDLKQSLRLCNLRHENRMQKMKALIAKDDKNFEDQSLDELEGYWVKAKNQLKPQEKQLIENYLLDLSLSK